MSITPQRAAVRPRVVSQGEVEGERATDLLEDRIAALLASRRGAEVLLIAGPGAGLTTALRHLAAVFAEHARLELNESGACHIRAQAPEPAGAAGAGGTKSPTNGRLELELAPWGEDECIEYLLELHPERCASVMRRLRDAGDLDSLGGVAELVSAVLDHMAADEAALGATNALARRVDALLEHAAERGALEVLCLRYALEPGLAAAIERREEAAPRFEGELKLLRHAQARAEVAARTLITALERDQLRCETLPNLPIEIERRAAPLLRTRAPALRTLLRRFEAADAREAGAIASLLHAADRDSFADWIKSRTGRREKPMQLHSARLRAAPWNGLGMTGLVARDCNLSEAQLLRCVWHGADLRGSNFARADLSGAFIEGALAVGARFAHAKLVELRASKANLAESDLRHADLTGAVLEHANLRHARLEFAVLRGAVLLHSSLREALLEETDFTAADLRWTNLRGCDLRTCALREAQLDGAQLHEAQMSELDLRNVSAAGALLAGATLHGANLRGANLTRADLQRTRLADLDAEGADFSGADFTGAVFRLGTTRSGLVFNAPPMEGTRTGFYSDEFFGNPHRAPEEVRTANLCGAKLWGAKVDGADFYLVDLRGALYDEQQAQHFRRCGAILRDRDK